MTPDYRLEVTGGTMKYKAYVNYSVSQIVDVEADSIDEALDMALEEVDMPNIGNNFEPDSDPMVVNLTDENGDVVWDDSMTPRPVIGSQQGVT
jgi:hypothetical protein